MLLMFRRGVKPEQRKDPAIDREIRRFNDNLSKSRLIPQIESIDQVSPEQILEIAALGEVHDELDGLPLAEKLTAAREKGVRMVVADGIEDEPYLSSRLSVLAQFREQVISGLALCAKALNISEDGVSAAVYDGPMSFSHRIPSDKALKVRRLGGKYPLDKLLRRQGDKKGILYLGPGGLVHLHRAVYEQCRQTTAFVTLAGDCVSSPMNAELPLDMPMGRALEYCGLLSTPTYICQGGSLTGRPVLDLENSFISWDTRCVLAFHRYDHVAPSPCIGCGRCMKVCPQRLPVFYLYHASVHGLLSELRRIDDSRCLSCGACSYVCPARLDIVPALEKGREMVRARQEQVAQRLGEDSSPDQATQQEVSL